jgi:hypothetical protein
MLKRRGGSDDFRLPHTNDTFYHQGIQSAEMIDGGQPDRLESCGADHPQLRAPHARAARRDAVTYVVPWHGDRTSAALD